MPDLVSEARRVVEAAQQRGITLRLIGGLAIWLQAGSQPPSHRSHRDLDLVGYSRQHQEIQALLEGLGYRPEKRFNALHGHRRLLFHHPDGAYHVDVFLDSFFMCHELRFVGRLEEEEYTVPLPELLLSKLQIVELNEKDVQDIFTLLGEHDLSGEGRPGHIALRPIVGITYRDWGWYRTVSQNLGKLLQLLPGFLAGEEAARVEDRLRRLQRAVEEAPKSLPWRMRVAIGDRLPWYNLPEEVGH